MKILAIDPGTYETGVSWGERPITWWMSGRREERLQEFMANLDATLREAEETSEPYGLVAYERPFARGRDATRCLWGLAGIIEAMAEHHGAAVVDIPNQTLKAWATQAGLKRDKAPMIAAMEKLTGYSDLNEHEADAACIFEYVTATMVVTAAQQRKRK